MYSIILLFAICISESSGIICYTCQQNELSDCDPNSLAECRRYEVCKAAMITDSNGNFKISLGCTPLSVCEQIAIGKRASLDHPIQCCNFDKCNQYFQSSTCNKIDVFDAVARNLHIVNNYSRNCDVGGGKHDHDALVMTLCHTPDSSKWIQGDRVFRHDKCNEKVHRYTPVFFHDVRNNVEYRSVGILLSCEGQTLKVFYQDCNTTARITEIRPEYRDKIYELLWL